MPAAAAALLDTTPGTVIEAIGHDGSKILWPNLQDPNRRQGFNLQEIIDVFIANFECPVLIEPTPWHGPEGEEACYPYENPQERFTWYLEQRPGILLGQNHAVAWDGETIFDPRGSRYQLEDFEIEAFLALF